MRADADKGNQEIPDPGVEPYTIEVSAEMDAFNDIAEAKGPWQLAKAVWRNFTLREILTMPWGAAKYWWTGRLP